MNVAEIVQVEEDFPAGTRFMQHCEINLFLSLVLSHTSPPTNFSNR